MKISRLSRHLLTSLIVAAVLAAIAAAYRAADQAAEPPERTVPLGTTHFTQLDVEGPIEYGPNDLYPLGHVTSTQQLVYGTEYLTGTADVATGLSTVTWALCTLAGDPSTQAGATAHCTVEVAANTVTVKAWQDDFTAATDNTNIHWLAIGQP